MLTSMLERRSPSLVLIGSIRREVLPSRAIIEIFLLSSLSALIKSLIDSASIKFILPWKYAREENSPPVASLAPDFIHKSIILLNIIGEPCDIISTLFSPVKECGAMYNRSTTSSTVSVPSIICP